MEMREDEDGRSWSLLEDDEAITRREERMGQKYGMRKREGKSKLIFTTTPLIKHSQRFQKPRELTNRTWGAQVKKRHARVLVFFFSKLWYFSSKTNIFFDKSLDSLRNMQVYFLCSIAVKHLFEKKTSKAENNMHLKHFLWTTQTYSPIPIH